MDTRTNETDDLHTYRDFTRDREDNRTAQELACKCMTHHGERPIVQCFDQAVTADNRRMLADSY